MIIKKPSKRANTEDIEAVKEALKNKQFTDYTKEELAKVNKRIIKDLLADLEADKKKFHFKKTREKNAKLEEKLKKLQEQNEQKLKGKR